MKPVYQRENVTLFHADCREVFPVLGTEIGLVLCDAPYSDHVHLKSRAGARVLPKDGSGRTPKACLSRAVDFGFDSLKHELRQAMAGEAARIGRFALQFSDIESSHLWLEAMTRAGLEYARTGIWRKLCSAPQFTGRIPAAAADAITICKRKGDVRWNGHGRHGWWDYDMASEDFAAFMLYGGDVIYDVAVCQERLGVGQGEARVHTTQKPEALMVALVEDFSDPGETVYDFTSGFGTTAIGCIKAKGGRRRCILIEIDERWIEPSIKRIEAELAGSCYTPAIAKHGQQALF